MVLRKGIIIIYINKENDLQKNIGSSVPRNRIIFLRITGLYLAFAVSYYLLRMWLESNGMEYRTWATLLGNLVIFPTPPILLGYLFKNFISKTRRKLKQEEKASKGFVIGYNIVFPIYVFVISMVLAILGISALFHLPTEDNIGNVMIRVNVPHFLDESTYYYCDKVSFFARKEFVWDVERELGMMEQKYGTTFSEAPAQSDGVRRYVPNEHPEIAIRIYGYVPWMDDYSSKLSYFSFRKYYEENHMTREWSTMSNYGSGDDCYLSLTCTSEDDIEGFAEDAAKLIAYVMQDPFYEDHVGWLNCKFKNGDKTWTRCALYFGNYVPFEKDGKAKDYYANPKYVVKAVQDGYADMK